MAKGRSRREQRYLQSQSRKRRRLIGGVVALVLTAVIVIVAVLAVGGGGDDRVTARLTLDDFSITGDLEVPAGEIRLVAGNVGQIPHNVGLRGGPISAELRPGQQGSVDIGDLGPGTYELYCDIIGHEDAGMVATLTVTEPTPEG